MNITQNIKDKLLLASIFFTGLVILIIEVVAIRILSPYYGNTIYATSSVIGVVLAALSLGYFFGGKMSDKYPSFGIFYGIIILSGFLVIFLHILDNVFLPVLGALLPITTGPLVSSVFLFLVPSFFLGTLSPFAVKLHKKEADKIGSRSGEVFFWSTTGSIMGSLLSGFFLIPHFGTDFIVLATGIFLCLWGFCGFLIFGSGSKKIAIYIILFFIGAIFLAWLYVPQKQEGIIYEKDGIYEKVKIIDGKWNDRPTRFLMQDRTNSAAMYLDSDELVYDYTKYYELYKLFNPQATSAFVIGGGAYSIPKALLKDSPDMQVDVAEVEPELFNLAKKYFNLANDGRLTNYIEDGRYFLNKTQKRYDIIISDVYYSLFSIPIQFTTREFFDLAKSRLNDNGVFIANFSGDIDKQYPSLILSEIKTLKEVFPNSYFFAVNSPVSTTPQNIIFLGINGTKRLDFKSDAILKSDNPIINGLPQKNIDLNNFEFYKYEQITDNFAPIEHLVREVIDRWR